MEQTARRHFNGFSGNALKLIAAVAMVIDHIGAGIIEPGIFHLPDLAAMNMVLATPSGMRWYVVDFVLRTIGRLAFPIFCFLLVEGVMHTHNVKKYAGSILLFALISEIPFDLLFMGSWLEFSHQNVYFTLFIGIMVLIGYKRYVLQPVKQTLVLVLGCAVAAFIKCDYSMTGIILIVIFYMFQNNKRYQTMFGGLLVAADSFSNFGAAVLAFIPIRMYNGKRGIYNIKYFFYWFYPVHLLVLYLIRKLIFF